MTVPRRGDVSESPLGIEARKQGCRKLPPFRIQPKGRRSREDPDAMHGPHRIMVVDTLRVMPHAVAVDQVCTHRCGDAKEFSVHRGWDTAEHVIRCLASRPLASNGVMVAADSARGHHHGTCRGLEMPDDGPRRTLAARRRRGFQDFTGDAGHSAGVLHQG